MTWRSVRVPSRLGCAAVLLFGVVACGGASAPAEAPESAAVDESQDSAADVSEDNDTSVDTASASASETSASETASEPVDVQTFQNALQAVIGDPALLTAMGHDPSSTKPVLISGKDLPAGLERAAVIRSIEVVPLTDKPGKRTILLFTRIELTSERGTFKYRCEATGAYGTTRVAYENGGWQLKASQISQP